MADSIYASEALSSVPVLPEELKLPLDLSHHFSRVTKARKDSDIKMFYKFFRLPGIGNLAGGLPSASYFPYDTLEASVAIPERFEPTSNKPNKSETINGKLAKSTISDPSLTASHMIVPHLSDAVDPLRKIDLTSALQYGQSSGYPPLLSFIREFTRENLHPNIPYLDGPEVTLTVGATDGIAKSLEVFSNVWSEERDWVREREGILCEKFAYPMALQACRPRGLQVVPVKMDGDGMLATGKGGLEDILANWDFKTGKRPHLMYTITVGQNPTGVTLRIERRREIYALCSKYDVMIIEDDPYFFIQFPSAAVQQAAARNLPRPYAPMHTPSPTSKSSGFPFLDSLVPSYLSIDTDGRVVRLDTFSKTVAPGCRLGWVTAQPAIIERINRVAEATTQQPSGFVQAMLAEVIMGPQSKSDGGRGGKKNGKGWSVDGWVRWLEGLRGNYERRMTRMCTILEDGRFALKQQTPIKEEEHEWAVVTKVKIYEFDWPSGGWFVWLKVIFENHPLWGAVEGDELSTALWIFLTSKPYLVLLAPGKMFSQSDEISETEGWKYFRICYAAVDDEVVTACSVRMVQGITDFWKIKNPKDLPHMDDLTTGNREGLTDMSMYCAC